MKVTVVAGLLAEWNVNVDAAHFFIRSSLLFTKASQPE
jgi:hypothetical protein